MASKVVQTTHNVTKGYIVTSSIIKDILEEYSIQGKNQCVVLIPGIFDNDICKLKLDFEVEATVSEWNKSRVPDAIVLNGCAILWTVAMDWLLRVWSKALQNIDE